MLAFKHYKARAIKQHGIDINTDKYTNRNKSPEINPHIYGQLIFDRDSRIINGGKDRLFAKWCWENWLTKCRKMKMYSFLFTPQKINLKWIKDINMRPETVKLLEENSKTYLTLVLTITFFGYH